jgi:hypothetical protein
MTPFHATDGDYTSLALAAADLDTTERDERACVGALLRAARLRGAQTTPHLFATAPRPCQEVVEARESASVTAGEDGEPSIVGEQAPSGSEVAPL